ncbi:hypothetical protein [Amphiplicatus metriothermophilus]|uniref:Transmembrane protein (PGPGW) n=1 Tax=Amphiplicatus metriothermophilus TaxID=1519374 RepID=A0A239Q0J6_9PROT|nr:hypothetical protein [Amphiplicatus metriothermophilus]MBB5520072.1 xanthosine utilization system XapX-like protein [Amphiplicatus metriothermophilus]SNT75868.1 hypothetical protein SAMN06297382_2944 [Amphiplicatus metriothermophilus]
MLARLLTSLTGAVLIVYGIVAAVSPLPAGVVLIGVGLLMIALANPAARPLIRALRRRWRWFDRLVEMAGKRAPKNVKSVVEETDPGGEAESAREGDGC